MRLETLIGKWAKVGKSRARALIQQGVVTVNGKQSENGKMIVSRFDHIICEGASVQTHERRVIILHKPIGFISATSDLHFPTVIELINAPFNRELHLAGRLDRATSGLMILTNDSRVSEALTRPERKVGKRYLVKVDGVITAEVVSDFQAGIWFPKEQVKSHPAVIDLLDSSTARLTIYEGKHHQVKRMFAHHRLKVLRLHREAIGDIELPVDLLPGEWREISFTESH